MTDPLYTPLGLPGSGRQRYAAAMALHRDGLISDAVLEVYRICSPLDAQDPVILLTAQHLPIPAPASVTAQSALRDLLAAIDTHLATLSGPGVAEVRAGLNACRFDPVSPGAGIENPALLANLDLLPPVLAVVLTYASPHLHWPPGQHFVVLIGENGPWRASGFALGLSLTGPPPTADFYTPLTPDLGIYARTVIADKS
jgi:hypothetical protein